MSNFITKINKFKNTKEARKIDIAKDSCFSISEHIEVLNKRLIRLKSLPKITFIHEEAKNFINTQMVPFSEKILKKLNKSYSSKFLDSHINENEKIISPSDFGLHNLLKNKNEIYFLDFEYSGWDDPAKLICDFRCNPENKISKSSFKLFIDKTFKNLDYKNLYERVKILLPIYRIIWNSIILNEFLHIDSQRRKFAGFMNETTLKTQLIKAKKYFHNTEEKLHGLY